MKEIGGYFGLDEFGGKEYHSELIAVNNGRNALVYLCKALSIKKLYIPYFLCDSVSGVCNREGYAYGYYEIGSDFLPRFEKELDVGEYLYVVNYFGQIDRDTVISLKKRYGNIILDNVQAFFEKPIENIDTVYSCRKFFGVPDGGYVSTVARLCEPLPQDVSMDRMKHILGRFEGTRASDYYVDFKSNDSSFARLELRQMSRLTHNILKSIDYGSAKSKRESNFNYLHSALGNLNILNPVLPVGPYAYPFYFKDGMALKKRLAQRGIFVPTLWPNVLERVGTLECDFAENILPLPCDQRYDIEDMERIVCELNNIIEENK